MTVWKVTIRILYVLKGLAGLGALSACLWAALQLGSAVQENRKDAHTAVTGAAAALSPTGAGIPTVFNEARDITIAVLKPCKPGKPETCGLIPSVRNVAVDTGSAVRTMGDQVKQTQPLVEGAAKAISDTSTHANKAIDAATEATQQARADLQTLNGTISAGRPLLEAYTRAGDSLNEILKRQAISRILDNTASMTESGAGILADGRKVTDKATADYLTPQSWYRKVGRYASDAFDYGALFARHTP